MTNIEQHKTDYLSGATTDCPYCGKDNPDHSCRNCYSEMNTETCWEYKGHCSEKCKKNIEEELPAIRKQKIEKGIVCQCNEPTCRKCLVAGCNDDECPTHQLQKKTAVRKARDLK